MTTATARSHRHRRLTELIAGLSAAALVFLAVPSVLALAVGAPLPGPWARPAGPSRVVFDVLGAVAWVAWLSCAAPLLRAVIDRVRRGDTSTGRGARVIDRLAARIAGAVLVVVPLTLVLGAEAGATVPGGARYGVQHAVAVATVTAPGVPSPPGPVALPALPAHPGNAPVASRPVPPAATAARPTPYVVRPEDSLWSVAKRFYGDGNEWPAIATVNLGRLMTDGTRFVDPSLIRPDWVLLLPTNGTDPATAGSATSVDVPAVNVPAVDVPAVGAPEVTAAGGGVLRDDHALFAGDPHAARRGPPAQPPRRPALPELAVLGMGAVGAAALARRVRRQRRASDIVAGVGGRGEPDAAIDLAMLVARFDDAPVLRWFELANRHLSASLTSMSPWLTPPGVRLFRVGPDGVDAWLAAAVDWSPGPWELREGGRVWHLSTRHDPTQLGAACRAQGPLCPAVVPIGDDDRGTWLAVVEPGSCLPVIGATAGALVAAMRLTAECWPWSDQLTVTADPSTAERESGLDASSRCTVGDGRPRILFVGDPAALSARAAARCGTLTPLPVPASDVTVAVDDLAATIHPIGVTVRPHLLRPRQRDLAIELLGEAPRGAGAGTGVADDAAVPFPRRAALDATDPAGGHAPEGDPAQAGPADPTEVEADRAEAAPSAKTREAEPPSAPEAAPEPAAAGTATAGPGASPRQLQRPVASLDPGPVEVRLLVPVPRIDGLQHELPPKRVRRATELVAYLALHHPSPVTSDRLRTRVLGSPDADAAAKTLFNVAAAARRAMGPNDAGEPYLPPALKTGHYRISELVSVDVDRAADLVDAARSAVDPDESLALYRAALDLVQGEPLSGVLSGYEWWRAEGHAGRVRSLLVDAACEIVRLATAGGYSDLAAWAIDRARVIDPYSEMLSQAAMRWAAACGDADRLRREWLDCQRMVDDLDPGSLPSDRTERLYASLSKQLASGARGSAGTAG